MDTEENLFLLACYYRTVLAALIPILAAGSVGFCVVENAPLP